MEKNILTFKELEEGGKFISFPVDGDNAGHGGYKKPHNIFIKLKAAEITDSGNALRDMDGIRSHMPPDMEILHVQ